MKANIANCVYSDLVKRFPMRTDKIVDGDVLDVLLKKWSSGEYIIPDSSLKLHHKQKIKPINFV